MKIKNNIIKMLLACTMAFAFTTSMVGFENNEAEAATVVKTNYVKNKVTRQEAQSLALKTFSKKVKNADFKKLSIQGVNTSKATVYINYVDKKKGKTKTFIAKVTKQSGKKAKLVSYSVKNGLHLPFSYRV